MGNWNKYTSQKKYNTLKKFSASFAIRKIQIKVTPYSSKNGDIKVQKPSAGQVMGKK